MRNTCLVVLTSLAVGSAGCSPDPGAVSRFSQPPVHPVLDRDYTAPFVGTWNVTGTLTMAGTIDTSSGTQEIARTGYNRLAIKGMCPGIDGAAGLDSPATFSTDPLTCPPEPQPCGNVTVRYRSGTGQLDGGTLTATFQGDATGCGQTLQFTLSFSGTLPPPPPPPPHGAPVAVVAPASAETDAGVPVSLDAGGSTDPGGETLTYSWSIASSPSGSTPTLTGAETATPTFSADVPGSYQLALVVTAADGQTGTAVVRIFVRPVLGTQSWIHLESDPGDYIGGGRTYFYTKADAVLALTATGGHLAVTVTGNESWWGDFAEPNTLSQLEPGLYDQLTRYPFHDAARGGLSWSGEGRGCNTLTGSFAIDEVTYAGSTIATLDLRFEQHCEGGTAALHGRIHWNAADTTAPPGPVNPPPEGLWQPAAGTTPASGNYVYLESDAGDWVGAGKSHLYTQADAVLSVTSGDARVAVSVTGNESWSGAFQAMNTLTRLEPGYYGGLERYPFQNPALGGLSWSGEGRGCNTLSGWFVVDGITYSGTTVTAIDLRFEQHCEGGVPALRGQIHWYAGDTTAPPGPVDPPPTGLWQPAAGTTPASGSYVYLESDPGDWVGAGGTYLYTLADALIGITASSGLVSVTVTGDQSWNGVFKAMSTLTQLEPGYYGDLQRYPFQNPTRGGLSWSGEGRGCNTLTGWFVVDGIAYSGTTVTAIDLRFEQHCEGGGPALRGQIHWYAGDTTQPPGPVNPPPAGLWQPAAGSTPASGNYVYLVSDPGDYIGAGGTYLYTPADATLGVSGNGNLLSVRVDRANDGWWGDFQAMSFLTQLEPGYYGGLERYPFHNPLRGGLSWWGNGRGCNTLTGWFVVDGAAYSGTVLAAIDLRFEQHCEGGGPALRGQIRWSSAP